MCIGIKASPKNGAHKPSQMRACMLLTKQIQNLGRSCSGEQAGKHLFRFVESMNQSASSMGCLGLSLEPDFHAEAIG